MITLEQVEKLTQKTGVSFSEAKAALEASDGDMLDAVLLLEYQGKLETVASGRYSSHDEEPGKYDFASENTSAERGYEPTKGNGFWAVLKRLLHVANTNHLEILRNSETVVMMPISVLVLLAILSSGSVLFLFLIGLFFGYRYIFRGPELGRDELNRVMEQTGDAFEQMRQHTRQRRERRHEDREHRDRW